MCMFCPLRGAELNSSDCYHNLGIMYAFGIGTERNETAGISFADDLHIYLSTATAFTNHERSDL